MTIAEFDHLPVEKKKELLLKCCGSSAWADKMLAVFPVEDLVELLDFAEEKWYEVSEDDWREAFTHHPKIGDIEALKKKFDTKEWAAGEQAGVAGSPEDIIRQLAEGNREYEQKFGYIFIVSATGKTAIEILQILKRRLNNDRDEELKSAAGEQNKITKIRLEKLFGIEENKITNE